MVKGFPFSLCSMIVSYRKNWYCEYCGAVRGGRRYLVEKWKITSALSTIPLLRTNDTSNRVPINKNFQYSDFWRYRWHGIKLTFGDRSIINETELHTDFFNAHQLEIYRLIQSLPKHGLGYRRTAKVLNEKGFTSEQGHLWKKINVYSEFKRYSERQDRLKFRRKKYFLVRGRMWIEFAR